MGSAGKNNSRHAARRPLQSHSLFRMVIFRINLSCSDPVLS
jgi:hypothetical protein